MTEVAAATRVQPGDGLIEDQQLVRKHRLLGPATPHRRRAAKRGYRRSRSRRRERMEELARCRSPGAEMQGDGENFGAENEWRRSVP